MLCKWPPSYSLFHWGFTVLRSGFLFFASYFCVFAVFGVEIWFSPFAFLGFLWLALCYCWGSEEIWLNHWNSSRSKFRKKPSLFGLTVDFHLLRLPWHEVVDWRVVYVGGLGRENQMRVKLKLIVFCSETGFGWDFGRWGLSGDIPKWGFTVCSLLFWRFRLILLVDLCYFCSDWKVLQSLLRSWKILLVLQICGSSSFSFVASYWNEAFNCWF